MDRSQSPPARPPSRRDFLRGAAAGVAATGVAGCVEAQNSDQPALPKIVKTAVAIRLMVNGRPLAVRVEPRTTLLDALRDGLTPAGAPIDLTGAKPVCDRGTCGACTVHLDGRPVYACSVLALDAVGHEIRTVEGLGRDGALHPVQEAFVAHDALMCGFCTPGFVMAAAALLEHNRNPSRADITAALDGNLCRCGTYRRVIEAVEAAAARLREG